MATRAHVVLPDELLSELDDLVGPRGRSQYIADAVREKMMRERQHHALIASAGILADEEIPEWETSEAVIEWVSRGRTDDRSMSFPTEQ
jgi:metal-responsive CopG/Arc/MetJ family transcriptional regulator